MPMVKACQKEEAATKNFTQKRHYQRAVKDMGSVFAACCVCCEDAAEVLNNYKKALFHLMTEKGYAEAGIEIAKGFAILVRSCQRVLKGTNEKEEEIDGMEDGEEADGEEEDETEENNELDPDTDPVFLRVLEDSRAPALPREVAEKTLACVASMAEPLLQALGRLYEHCHGDFKVEYSKATGVGKGGELGQVLTLRSVMTVVCEAAPTEVVQGLFDRTLAGLEEALKKDDSDVVAQGLRVVLAGKLAVTLPWIPAANVPRAMAVVQPRLEDASVSALQRRLYYCLLLLCRYHAAVFARAGEMAGLTERLLDVEKTANAMVRKYRIKSLFFLWGALDPAEEASVALIVSTLPRLVLWIKDANEKVRAVCFQCLIRLARVMDASTAEITLPTGDTTPCSLLEFFKILIGCMAAASPRMKSASLMCLSFVTYHYRGNEAIWPLVCHHMHVVYGVLDDKNRELIKACFGFIRTCVKVMPEEMLKEELHDVVLTMLPWANDPKNRFKLRVRGIIELAVRRMGKDVVLNEVPESEREKVLEVLNNKPKLTNEDLVKEMEAEAAKLAKEDEYDDKEVVEMDDVKGDEALAALIEEIAKSEDLKRAVERREEMEEEMEMEEESVEEEVMEKPAKEVVAKKPAKEVIAKKPAKEEKEKPVKEEKEKPVKEEKKKVKEEKKKEKKDEKKDKKDSKEKTTKKEKKGKTEKAK